MAVEVVGFLKTAEGADIEEHETHRNAGRFLGVHQTAAEFVVALAVGPSWKQLFYLLFFFFRLSVVVTSLTW